MINLNENFVLNTKELCEILKDDLKHFNDSKIFLSTMLNLENNHHMCNIYSFHLLNEILTMLNKNKIDLKFPDLDDDEFCSPVSYLIFPNFYYETYDSDFICTKFNIDVIYKEFGKIKYEFKTVFKIEYKVFNSEIFYNPDSLVIESFEETKNF